MEQNNTTALSYPEQIRWKFAALQGVLPHIVVPFSGSVPELSYFYAFKDGELSVIQGKEKNEYDFVFLKDKSSINTQYEKFFMYCSNAIRERYKVWWFPPQGTFTLKKGDESRVFARELSCLVPVEFDDELKKRFRSLLTRGEFPCTFVRFRRKQDLLWPDFVSVIDNPDLLNEDGQDAF